MKAVYEYPIPMGKFVLLSALGLAYPSYLFLRMAWDMGAQSLRDAMPWWGFLVKLALLLGLGIFFVWLHRGHFRRARLELEGTRLDLHFGVGLQSPGILVGGSVKGDCLQIDLDDAFVEWAGLALNVRTRAFGTLAIGHGEAAQPIADWLTAHGHPPVRVY